MPFFSVIIPVYNRYDQVRRAIDSVLAQDCKDYELIVIDDGSTDRTAEIESLYHGRLRYIRQENLGVSAARNCGIKLSQSPHVTFLDSDDEWQPGKLQGHKDFIHHNPGVKIHQCDDIWVRNGKRVNMSARYKKNDGIIFGKSLELCSIAPSSVCINAELFEIYGLFDELMPACEDYDLWIRITPFEFTGLLDKKLTIKHSGHEGQLSGIFWGMDRFRAYSILKLLDERGSRLTAEQRESAAESVLNRIAILKKGSEKRGNLEFAATLDQVLESFRDGCCTRKCYQSLLGI